MQVFVVYGYRHRDVYFGSIDDVIDTEETYVDSIFSSKGEAEAHALSINGYTETFDVK